MFPDASTAIPAVRLNRADVASSLSPLYPATLIDAPVIRRGLSTTVTTVAGTGVAGYSGDEGLAISARFNRTGGIALDASGNIYVSDTYYHVIRMIMKSTGIITTVAGTGLRSRYGLGYIGYYTGDGGLATNATLSVEVI